MDLGEHSFRLSIELAGRNPQQVALAIADALSAVPEQLRCELRAPWAVVDAQSREWRATGLDARGTRVLLTSPALRYADVASIHEVLRAVRRAGARIADGSKPELAVETARLDARVTANVSKIVAKQRQLMAPALGLDADAMEARIEAKPHASIVLPLGATLNAAELCAAVVLALAIVGRAKTARGVSSKLRPYSPTSARYDFRCFLLRLGLIGEEYRAAREHLMKRLPGSSAWKRGRPPQPGRLQHWLTS
jgi:hypothetical protein